MKDRQAIQNCFKPRYFAHRGLFNNETDWPENTIPAFKRAVEHGYGIELDVQLSKDKQVVVAHDYTLERICSADKLIKDLTYQEICGYKILKSAEVIPLFTDVLKIIDGKVPLIVEIKTEKDYKEVCELTSEILLSYSGVYCIESFSPYAVGWYKKNYPDVIRGQLADDFVSAKYFKSKLQNYVLTNMFFNAVYKPDFIAYNHQFKDKKCLAFWKKSLDCTLVAWTIKSQAELDSAAGTFDYFIFDSFIPE